MMAKDPGTIPQSAQLIQNLAGIVGFDPTKSIQPNKEVFAEVVKELGEERAIKAKEQAKALASEAIKGAEEFGRIQKAYLQAETKFVKEFAKIMKKVEALAAGQEAPADDEETTKTG